jgi:hypothetical protein
MQTTTGARAVPYREVMGWLGTTTLVLLVLAPGPATPTRAGPPPRPRLPPPPAVRTDIDGSRLERRDDGSLRKVDAEARFEGIIHPDGRVEVRDLPDARVELTTGRASVDWVLGFIRAIENPGSHDRPDLEPPAPDREDRTNAGVQTMPPSPYGPAPILIGVGGRFGGAADLALRKGQRKQARAKEEFLDSTAPLRAALARAKAHEQQRAARSRLGQELATVWRDRRLSLAERKRQLFERWDECEEAIAGNDAAGEAISETDAERGHGGEELRRRIEAFVRQVAPAGSAQAFGEAELSRLNAGRQSRQRFDPYAPERDEAGEDPAASGSVAR